jgi:hypothetical protein
VKPPRQTMCEDFATKIVDDLAGDGLGSERQVEEARCVFDERGGRAAGEQPNRHDKPDGHGHEGGRGYASLTGVSHETVT